MLKSLRDRGLKAVIFEAGHDTGGTWRWNVSDSHKYTYLKHVLRPCRIPIPYRTLHISLMDVRKQLPEAS